MSVYARCEYQGVARFGFANQDGIAELNGGLFDAPIPETRRMKAGGVVEVAIEDIGTLRNSAA